MHQATTMLSSTASARTGSAIQRLPRVWPLLRIFFIFTSSLCQIWHGHGPKAPARFQL